MDVHIEERIRVICEELLILGLSEMKKRGPKKHRWTDTINVDNMQVCN